MMASLYRVWAISVKEITQLRRDRLTFGMVVMIPLIQLLLFGYTINTDIRNVPIVVVDDAQSSFSRQLIQDVQATQVVLIADYVDTPSEMMTKVQEGHYPAGLYIPHDAERRYYAQNNEPIAQLVVDGSDTVMASAMKSLGTMPFKPGEVVSVDKTPTLLTVELLYNPESRSALFTVPGLLGVILTMTMVMFTAVAIVRERERGNIELLIATPVKTYELMIGKIVPYIVIGLLQMVIILALGYGLFDVPIVGSWWLLFMVGMVFIMANLGLGLLLSTIAPSQLGAIQMFIFFFLPSILLSGFMFPYLAMPVVAQWLAEALPMTHFLRMVRGIILRGAEMPGIWQDLVFLLGFFVVTMIVAMLRFNRKLD